MAAHEAPLGSYPFRQWDYRAEGGQLVARLIKIETLAHAWSGGSPAGSYTDADGPDATAMTLAFFEEVRPGG